MPKSVDVPAGAVLAALLTLTVAALRELLPDQGVRLLRDLGLAAPRETAGTDNPESSQP